MALQMFFYDNQIRRFLLQYIRAFSNFQVEFGKNEDGTMALQQVPVKYGDLSRNAASIIRDNSENKIISTPMMSCYIESLTYDREMMQDPTFVEKKHVRQRKFDDATGEYLTTQGNAFTIERLMPAPYKLTLKTDIWTSNTEQKLQLLEQLLVLFNPDLEIQSTDNYFDWTSLSRITLTDVNWSSRSVPIGESIDIDLATLTFELPIWLTAPAKIKKLGVIQKIVISVFDETGGIADGVIDSDILMGSRMYFTPLNYGALLIGNQLQLLELDSNVSAQNDTIEVPAKIGTGDTSWRSVLGGFGETQDGISQIRLTHDNAGEVVGTIAFHPTDPSILLFTVDTDTIPTNDLTTVHAIINPLTSGPSIGLPAAATGRRYLILQDIGTAANTDGADAWKGTGGEELIASANDIIEYDGTQWNVDFDASTQLGIHYVANMNTTIQYKWTGSEWVKSYEGEYKPGRWCLVI